MWMQSTFFSDYFLPVTIMGVRCPKFFEDMAPLLLFKGISARNQSSSGTRI
jgi:hypothetical protein